MIPVSRILCLAIRAISGFNRVLHLLPCPIHSLVRAPLQIPASSTHLTNAVVHTLDDVLSQFLSSLRRQQQSNRRTHSCPQNKRKNRRRNTISPHLKPPLTPGQSNFSFRCLFVERRGGSRNSAPSPSRFIRFTFVRGAFVCCD